MKIHSDVRAQFNKTPEARELFGTELRQQFEKNLPESVERIWELPPIIETRQQEPYASLLREVRELFVAGYFYSCVAMCGIVGERYSKDLLRASVLTKNEGAVSTPSEDAFKYLERVEISGIIGFLKETGTLADNAAKAAKDLCELRNSYAHARGKEFGRDARKAIELLHTLIDRTAPLPI